MAELSRRGFLQKSSAAMVGGAAVIGALANEIKPASASPRKTRQATESVDASEPVVALVRAGRAGEVSIMVGDREVVHRDPDLARRLLRAAK